MADEPPQTQVRTFSTAVIATLACVTTLAVWVDHAPIPLLGREPLLILGPLVSVTVWLLMIASAVNRGQARLIRKSLELVRNRESLVEIPLEHASEPAIPLTYKPALIVAGLILACAIALRFQHYALYWVVGPNPAFLPALTTGIIGVLALHALRHSSRARRYAIALHASDGGTRLVEDVLETFPVMVSIYLPGGSRTHFNARFREVTGRNEKALAGEGWLDCVHESDREVFQQLAANVGRRKKFRELEYGMTNGHGANRWIRERFVPRFLDGGELVGYLAIGIDITDQVEAETERTEQIEKLSSELNEIRSELDEAHATSKELKSETSKATRARDRALEKVEAAKVDVKAATQGVTEAQHRADEAKAQLESLEEELTRTKSENKALNQTIGRLETKIDSFKKFKSQMDEQLQEAQGRLTSAIESAEQDRHAAAQLRSKVSRLTSSSQELEGKLSKTEVELKEALDRSARAESDLEEQTNQRILGMAGSLRTPIDCTQDLLAQSLGGTLSNDHVNDLETVQASLGSILALIDGVVGKDPPSKLIESRGDSSERPFDLRAALESSVALLESHVPKGEVTLACEVDKEFPSQVCGDSVLIRKALLILGAQAMHVVGRGTLTFRLVPDGTTPTRVAAKLSILHDEAELDDEALQEAFGVEKSRRKSGGSADATRRRASVAWKIIRGLKGEFGLEASSPTGFEVWFTLNLSRWNPTPKRLQTVTPPQESPAGAARKRAPGPKPMVAPKDDSEANIPKPASGEVPKNAPRLPQELLKSNLGDVKELGPRGARVKCGKTQKGEVTLELTGSDGQTIELPATVTSCKRSGARNFDTVLEFVPLDPKRRKQVLEIAMSHRPLTMQPLSDEP